LQESSDESQEGKESKEIKKVEAPIVLSEEKSSNIYSAPYFPPAPEPMAFPFAQNIPQHNPFLYGPAVLRPGYSSISPLGYYSEPKIPTYDIPLITPLSSAPVPTYPMSLYNVQNMHEDKSKIPDAFRHKCDCQNSPAVNKTVSHIKDLPTTLTRPMSPHEHHHIHCEFCGHGMILHGNHFDFCHDGELHFIAPNGIIYQHKLEVSEVNPIGCRPLLQFPWHANGPPKDESSVCVSEMMKQELGKAKEGKNIEDLHEVWHKYSECVNGEAGAGSNMQVTSFNNVVDRMYNATVKESDVHKILQ
jgi:hypothetical protein